MQFFFQSYGYQQNWASFAAALLVEGLHEEIVLLNCPCNWFQNYFLLCSFSLRAQCIFVNWSTFFFACTISRNRKQSLLLLVYQCDEHAKGKQKLQTKQREREMLFSLSFSYLRNERSFFFFFFPSHCSLSCQIFCRRLIIKKTSPLPPLSLLPIHIRLLSRPNVSRI